MKVNKLLSKIITCFSILLITFTALTFKVEAAKLIKKQDMVEIKTHKVKYKETLWSISKKYNVSLDKIKKFNNLKNSQINHSQEIKIPYFKTVSLIKVEDDDTLWSISQQYNTTIKEIKSFNGLIGNTIYSGQHLIIIKDNPDIFYNQDQIPKKRELIINWKQDYWIVRSLANLASDEQTREKIKQEIVKDESITRLKLAIILDQILHELKNIQESPSTPEKKEDPPPETNEAKNKLNLTESEIKQIKKLMKYFEEDLSKLGMKIDTLEGEIHTLKEKEKEEEQYTKLQMQGQTKLEWQNFNSDTPEENLNQIIFIEVQSILNKSKQLDFFFQALYNYFDEQQTTITVGNQNNFALNENNHFALTFAHQQPIDTKAADKLTYADAKYTCNNSWLDLKLISAHSIKFRESKESLNLLKTTFKTSPVDLTLSYNNRSQSFIPINLVGDSLINKDHLLEVQEQIEANISYHVLENLDLRIGAQRSDEIYGALAGIKLHSGDNWHWTIDYVKWEEDILVSDSIFSDIVYKIDPFKFKANLSYTTDDNQNTSTQVKTRSTINLTDYLTLNLEYNHNIFNPAFDESKFGVAFKF